MRYSVELRHHDEYGDYTENHYDFETRQEAMEFAYKYAGDVHSVLDYEDRDYDPIDITPF